MGKHFPVHWLHISFIICSFIRADIRPNKIARGQIDLSQKQPAEPDFQSVLCDGFKANAPPSQGVAEEKGLAVESDQTMALTRRVHICG
jgi:hypothetical protein